MYWSQGACSRVEPPGGRLCRDGIVDADYMELLRQRSPEQSRHPGDSRGAEA